MVIYAKISPKIVNASNIAGNAEEEELLLIMAVVLDAMICTFKVHS